MAGLLYYLPGKGREVKLADLRGLGLGYAFEERCTPRGARTGPDGRGGVVVADDGRVPADRIGYYPDKQTWRRIPTVEAWVGCYTAERPTPAELARVRVVPGHLVRLADGQQWEIPVARGVTEQNEELVGFCALPTVIGVDERGEWSRDKVLARYEHLWPIALRWWDALRGAATSEGGGVVTMTLDFAGINDAALVALAVNYRVGKPEVALLELFDEQAVREVLNAVVDWPTVTDWLKKKLAPAGPVEAAGLPTGVGPGEDTPDTDPR